MPIPNNIKREHILEAISEIDRDGIRQGRESQRYFLVENGKHYPLKYIISLANKYVNGEELDPNPSNFNTYSAWNYLADLDFELLDIKEDEIKKYNGFKLISLELENNSLICKDSSIIYQFIDENDLQDAIYSTVIIGPNGTGKSNLFRIVILLLKDIYDQKENRGKSYNIDGKFKIEYAIDEDIYSYCNFFVVDSLRVKNIAQLYKNDEPIDFQNAELPSFIVANSIMLTDKYPFIRDSSTFPFYKYLGVRNIAQSASTRSYVRKTVEFIVSQINSDMFKIGITKTGDFLGINKSIDIVFTTLNTPLFFSGNLNVETLGNYFNAIYEKYKKSGKIPPFKLNHYLNLDNNTTTLNEIVELCNKFHRDKKLEKIRKGSSARQIKFNIVDENDYKELKENYKLLNHLRQLGILSVPEINLNKGDEYNLAQSSSGEYHFFSSMIGLLATVKPNSLVFIDEPEISLHPNWQMKYLSFLRELFSEPEFASSHIVLATHSHFIISDLVGENSKIIGLKKEGNNNVIVDLPKNLNTYGWSAEQILLEVFKVSTSRNYYVAEKLGNLLDFISDPNSTDETIRLKFYELEIDKLSGLSVDDPLKVIYDTIMKEYVSS